MSWTFVLGAMGFVCALMFGWLGGLMYLMRIAGDTNRPLWHGLMVIMAMILWFAACVLVATKLTVDLAAS